MTKLPDVIFDRLLRAMFKKAPTKQTAVPKLLPAA